MKTKTPIPPMELGEIALSVWQNYWETKDESTFISSMDHYGICAFCNEYETYVTMRKVVLEVGSTFTTDKKYVCVRPEVSLGNKAFDNFKSMAKEFGFTMKSRISIGVVTGTKKKGDIMQSLMKKI